MACPVPCAVATCGFRVLVDPKVMASDASLSGGAIYKSTDLTSRGLLASHFAARQHTFCSDDEVILMCVGDELGVGPRACELLEMGVAAFARTRGEPTAERTCKFSWLDVTSGTMCTICVQATLLCAVGGFKNAGELAGSAKPTEDPSTVLRAALRQSRCSWPTVRLVAM